MTGLLEEAIATVRRLAERRRKIAAQLLLCFADHDAHRLPDQQVREIDLAKREVRGGETVSDTPLKEMWRRFDESPLR
jgi:hypothetical protein